MKRYKKYQLLFFTNIFFFFLIIIFFIVISMNDYNEYKKLNALYILDNIIEIFLTEKDLKRIEKNNYLYLNSKRQEVEILSITKDIYKRNDLYYHQVLIKMDKITKKTSLNISIFQKKKKIITLLKDIWREKT